MTTFPTKNESGYTLLEICISLGILAVVFFAVVPVIDGFIHERRLRDAGEQIQEFAAEVRGQAKNQGNFLVATIDGGSFVFPDGNSVTIDKEVRLAIRGGDGKWVSPEKYFWRFAPSGMVEPMYFRLEMGPRWLEMDIDPLTALVSDERFLF